MSLPDVPGLSKEEKAKLEAALGVVSGEEFLKAEDFNQSLGLLQKRRDTLFKVHVVLKETEGNEQTADYGWVYFRRWNNQEASEILGNATYMKSVKVVMEGAKVTKPDLSVTEQAELTRLSCKYIASACDKRHGFTEENLYQSSNQAWLRFMWAAIAARSGLDISVAKDIDEFFRET